MKEAYDVYAAGIGGSSPYNTSLFMFEGYSTQGVKAVDPKSSAFAYREDNLLCSPYIPFVPGSEEVETKGEALGNRLRDILYKGSDREELHTYVNYAFGSESSRECYGAEGWRQNRLKGLKNKYDPEGRFSFYMPVA